MASNVCWGVEAGAGAIKALKLEADGDDLRVLDFALIPHAKILSTPELDQADAMRVALGQLVSRFDLSGVPLAISVPGHQSFARFAKLPPVEPKKVPDIVKFEAVQQIPFPLEDVEWDYQTFVSPESPEIEVGIFAITRARIMERLQQLGDVGLTPEISTLSPAAAYNSLAVDLEFTEDTPGTIILDVGTVATDLIIAEAGRVWVRTFPMGGHQFTDALVEQFKLSYSKAERLKKEAEQTKHARHVFQAMRPVFADLVQEVQRSIGFYQSVHPGADLKRLLGLGSTFQLPGLRKYLKQQLSLDVYRIESFKKLKIDDDRAKQFEELAGNFAVAYGLALQGLAACPLRANVMPVSVLRESMWKRKGALFGAAAGVAAAAGAAMFIRPLMDNSALAGATPPPVIRQVQGTSRTLKAEAEEAQVLGSASMDLTPSRVLGALKDRDVYAASYMDAQLLVDAAQRDPFVSEDLPAGASAIELVSFDAKFAQPAGASSSGGGGGWLGQQPSVGNQGGGGQTPGFDPSTVERIDVTLAVSLPSDKAQTIASEVLLGWLNANAQMPYRERVLAGAKVVGGAGGAAADPRGAVGSGRIPGRGPGRDPSRGAARPNRSGNRSPQPSPGVAPGQSVESLAPLTKPESVVDRQTVTLTWSLVKPELMPQQPDAQTGVEG